MIAYRLKNINSKNATPIRMICFFEGVRLQIYTGLKIHPDNWLPETQKATENLKVFRGGRQINLELKKLNIGAEALAMSFKNAGIKLTTESFKQKFELDFFGRDSFKTEVVSIITHYDKYIEEESSKRGAVKLNPHRNVVGMIKRFYPKWDQLQLRDITTKFHTDLMDFILYKEGLSINYAGSISARLKTFMNVTLVAGLHTNQDFREFKRMTEEVDKIALSSDDLKKLANKKITIPGHDIARDLFMIQCVTGLRYSDVELLTTDNIRGKFLEVKTQKTGKPVTINIHAELQKILDKYNGFPPKLSKEKVNLYIKEVAKFAKLTDKIIIETTVKGQKVRTSHFLWELISTHTGRRTALTNMARQGIDLNSIRLVSGHTTIKQLQTYLKIDSEESATKLINHPYYKSL